MPYSAGVHPIAIGKSVQKTGLPYNNSLYPNWPLTVRSDGFPLPRSFAHSVRSWVCGERCVRMKWEYSRFKCEKFAKIRTHTHGGFGGCNPLNQSRGTLARGDSVCTGLNGIAVYLTRCWVQKKPSAVRGLLSDIGFSLIRYQSNKSTIPSEGIMRLLICGNTICPS